MKNRSEKPLGYVYLLRHQEPEKDADGSRGIDVPLSENGRQNARKLGEIVSALNPDYVTSGDLQRHQETARLMFGKNIPITPDSRLNAVRRASFLEGEGAETAVKDYSLKNFEADKNGLYHTEDSRDRPYSFNPETLGVFPFDKFTCRAHLDKELRRIVFPNDNTLEEVAGNVTNWQKDIIDRIQTAQEPQKIVAIGSGSINEFNAEFSQYGTIGENVIDPQATEKRPLFSQGYQEMDVFAYYRGDDRLTLVEKNVPIREYIERLKD